MSSYNKNNDTNIDNFLLQCLTTMQLQPPYLNTNSYLSQTLEDLLLNTNYEQQVMDARTHLAKEESKLEKEIISTILSGDIESLKPNSGQGVRVGEHTVCVGFHLEKDSDCRVWQWHGHIMMFDHEKGGYTPEYIYGNYFERPVLMNDGNFGNFGFWESGGVGAINGGNDDGDGGFLRSSDNSKSTQ